MDKQKSTEKKQEDLWRDVIYSGSEEAILEMLKILREKGNIKILPDIFNIYKGYKGTPLGKKIFTFLTDLKCSEATDLIISLIENPEYATIKQDLLSLCWQSSLDFSKHLDKFIDIFINDDLQPAFEAFTIIEYLDNIKDNETINKNIEKLQMSVSSISHDKKELLVDLVNILRKKLI